MKKEYSVGLKKFFLDGFLEEFPDFEMTKIKSEYISPGELVFVNTINEHLKLFIIVTKHAKGGNKFTVELGWSTINDFPELSMRPGFEEPNDLNIHTTCEYVCRIGSLINGIDKWWVLKDTALIKIKDPIQKLIAQSKKIDSIRLAEIVLPKVKDAIEKIKIFGVPFFDSVISAHTDSK